MAADGTHAAPFFNATTRGPRRLRKSFEQPSLPSGWDPVRASVNNINAQCFYARADTPEAIAFFVSGLQSSPLARLSELEHLRKQGISIISLALHPDTKDPEQYLRNNRELLQTLLFDEKSVLHSIGSNDLPRTLLPHSTAAFLTLDLITQNDNAERASHLFDGVTYLNPFLDMSKASQTHHPVRSWLYQVFSARHVKDPILTTSFERRMTKGTQGSKNFHYDTPRHQLIREILAHARKLQDEIYWDKRTGVQESAFRSLPQICLLGAEDNMICNQTAQDVMRHLGIDIRILAGNHGGPLEHPESIPELIKVIKNPENIRSPSPKPRAAGSILIPDYRLACMPVF